MKFQEFCIAVGRTLERNPSWRYGQTVFNVLETARSDLAEAIRGTDLDPFHQDKRVEACLCWIQENWETEEVY